MNGKGSRPRPVNMQKFNESFDRIFGNKNNLQDDLEKLSHGCEKLSHGYDKEKENEDEKDHG